MNVLEILSAAETLGITLRAEGDALVVRGPKGAIGPELRDAISARKSELLVLLGGAQDGAPITMREAGAPPVLSAGQERLWFLEQWSGASARYNVQAVLRIRGALDAAALAKSLDAIVARHEVLRTIVRDDGGTPRAEIVPEAKVAWTMIDGGAITIEGRDEALRRIARGAGEAPFALDEAPSLRATRVTFGDGDHAVVLTQHHSATDGASMGILVAELRAHYAALASNAAPQVAPLPIQYGDHAAWQRARLAGPRGAELASYWTKRLGALPRLDLPAPHAPPRVRTGLGASHRFTIDPQVTARLKEVARENDCTLFAGLVASFASLLHRYSAQTDFGLGTVVAGRDRREVASLLGFFVNTLVLRCDLSGDPSFAELLVRSGKTAREAFAHQELPFDAVVNAAAGERTGDLNPLVQASVVLESAPPAPFDVNGATWSIVTDAVDGSIEGGAKFDLSLVCVENEGQLDAAIEYSTDLYDAAWVARMARHFGALLTSLVAEPDGKVSRASYLSESERRDLVTTWNSAVGAPPEACAHTLFEAQAAARPDAIALVCGDERVTYAALNAGANRLARHLGALGAKPGDVIAIVLDPSVARVVAVLAVLKAGAAYLPIDPAYPAARIAFTLRDARASLVLTSSALHDRVTGTDARVVDVDRAAVEGEDGANLPNAASLDDLAYVIYTSGSTGTPKGVLILHRGLSNLVAQLHRALEMAPGARVLQFASFAFDASVWEIHGALTAGATLYLAPRDELLPGADLESFIEKNRISHALLSASALAVMDPSRVPSLTTLATGGEACPEPLAAKWAGGRALFNAYGPTEATVCVTIARWSDVAPHWTIGGPIANSQAYVLDAHHELVPLFVVGELCVGGIGLARGYLGRPELDREAFIADRFRGMGGARLYRTGDLARRLGNGALEIVGRRDEQVKIRGYRIELGEIEAALTALAAVRSAVVLAREDRPGDKRLVAYVVGDGDAASLNDALAERLPSYMIPSAYVTLDALPLTPSGKVDRKALPAPDRALSGSPYAAPATPNEVALASIWRELLGVTRVGLDDSFFALGGHSLLATRAVSRIRSELAADLSVRTLFENPTLRGLSRAIGPGASKSSRKTAPFTRVDRSVARPASFAQQRLWFLESLEPGLPTYNIPGAFRLRGPLDASALAAALGDLVARHESLRTTFVAEGGHPMLRIAAPSDGPFAVDVEDVASADDVVARAHAEAALPFSLAEGPLLRARLLRIGQDENVLLLTMHHIISDGWSVGVLLRELGVAYASRSKGAAPALAPLPLDYADFAAWERSPEAQAAVDFALAYWTSALASPTPLDLPSDRPRPSRPSQRGAALGLRLPRATWSALKETAAAHDVTPFMLLLAAYDVLLAKLSGQTDITVGTAIANRDWPELEAMVGLFVGTVALRTDVSDDPTFAALLARVRETTLSAFAHAEVPFDRVVQAVETTRDPSRSPIFQTMLVLQNATSGAGALGDVRLTPIPFESTTAKFDLTWSLEETDAGLEGTVEYATDLFDADTIARWRDHFVYLLESITNAPSLRLSELDLLRPNERAHVLTAWNATDAPLPNEPVHRLFEAQVRAQPDAIAVVFENDALTFAALNARANQLAHKLRALGLGREMLVGIALDRSIEMVVAVLAVLKSGAAYVPLDPAYPSERLDYMLADSQARALVTTRDGATRFAAHAVPTLLLDEEAEALAREPATNPEYCGSLDDLAYAIYTSGSTGRPKGALLEHRGVAAFTLAQVETLEIQPGKRILQFASFSFDASVWELFLALCGGATLHLAKREDILPGADLARFVAEHRIDTALLPPSALTVMDVASLAPITTLVLAGEACPEPLAARFAGGRRLFNAYGPTEATVYVTIDAWSNDAPHWSLGRAIANTRVYIVDRDGRPAPLGVAGEICVAGVGVGRGYLGQPELTAARFVADPFSAKGGRMYRTGDLGRLLAGGDVEYLGRLDHQVKVRGYRIELGEIESLLTRMPGVTSCAVIVREDVAGDKRIVAYVVGDADHATVIEELGKKLPSYMVPSAIVSLAVMPLTANGKVDRRALPAPALASSGSSFVPPETETQAILAGMWSEVLGLPKVGATDSFFALGGHSLLATQVMARVRQTFGVDVPLRALFEAPTIRGLEQAILLATRSNFAPLAPLVAGPRPRVIPLSFAQKRLWILEQLAPGLSAYNVSSALRVRGALDASALGRALDAIVQRHEVLRTVFVDSDAGAMQVIRPAARSVLVCEDVVSADDALARARQEANRPFSLGEGPLFRARLLSLGDADHLLVVTMHHIVSDGWSVGVLVRELTSLYECFVRGDEENLPALPVQYADYAIWESTAASTEGANASAAYWKDALAGVQPLDLPTDRPRPAVQTQRSATASFAVSATLTRSLHAVARSRGATLFMVLLAAYDVLLARLSGQNDVTVGTPIANRRLREVEPLIGFFVNTLVLRADVSADVPFTTFLDGVRGTALAAYAHQETPFERVVQESGASRDASRTPLFQTMFALQNVKMDALTLDGLVLEPIALENDTAKFDLTWSLHESEGGLRGSVEYAAELFDAETIARWLAHFIHVLETVAAAPETRLADLSLLGADEARALVDASEGSAVPRVDACIHHRFEAHAAEHPEAIAVVATDESVTYGALNARANRLAHYLRDRGASPDSLVAIAIESSVDRVVAVLAVLKSGAAYLPLDPAYPVERLAFTLTDSSARFLVTTRELAPRFAGAPCEAILVDHDAEAIAAMPSDDPAATAGARNLAYAIYTSGSTGRPKGVLLEHRGLVNLVAALTASLRIDARAEVLQFASFAFDASVWDMHVALASGATLHLGTRDELLPGPDLTAFVRARGITHALLPASALAVMSPSELPSLTTLATGGEACPEPLAETWARGRRLFNAYGPTEATVCATLSAWSDAAPRWTLGRPIANTRVRVLDPRGHLAPIGVAGELCIGGLGVGRGYLGRPELDREKFVADPFSGDAEARLYRAGDLARLRVDGNLEFLGRIDDQVKIRGHRIELGEIEAAILRHPSVTSAVVSAREDVPGDKRLVAYVVGDASALREHLGRTLPAYMLPSAFVTLNALPVTRSGKIDRKALPKPDGAPRAKGAAPPRSAMETIVARVWADELQVAAGRDDHFFEIGGHSLAAVRVAAKLRALLGRDVPVVALFREPVLKRYAAQLEPSMHAPEAIAEKQQAVKRQAAKQSAAIKRFGRDLRGTKK